MPQAPRMDVRGRTGLKQWSGILAQEFHAKLLGKRGVRIYTQMRDNDPVVGGILRAFTALIKQAEWRWEPADESPRSIEARDFVDSCLNDMSITWPNTLGEILSMLPFGWTYHEMVYKIRRGQNPDPRFRSKHDDGRIGWRKMEIRGQETLDRWDIGRDGAINGMWQMPPPTYERIYIPISKALLFRTDAHLNNPEGRSLLRNAYRPWYIKTRLEEIEAIGMERDLAGMPVMEVPPEILHPGAGTEETQLRTDLEAMVQQVKRDEREGMLVPSETDEDGNSTGYKFKLLTSGGRRSINVGQSIMRHETRMAMSVLAEFLFLGLDKVGSFALSQTKTMLFSASVNAVMDAVADPINRIEIPRLMTFNGFPPETWPHLEHGDVIAPALKDIADYISKLTGANLIIPDDELLRRVRLMARLPAPEKTLEEAEAEAEEKAKRIASQMNGLDTDDGDDEGEKTPAGDGVPS